MLTEKRLNKSSQCRRVWTRVRLACLLLAAPVLNILLAISCRIVNSAKAAPSGPRLRMLDWQSRKGDLNLVVTEPLFDDSIF